MLPDEAFTEAHSKRWDELAALADYRVNNAFEKFGKIQEDFAKKYNLFLY